jgi:hypothetical protein
MNCPECSHEGHGADPCGTCAAAGTTCWQKIHVVGGDGNENAVGMVEMATGKEAQPCLMCRFWEKVETKRVVAHFLQKGLEAQPDGRFATPIVKDYPGRKSLLLDPKNFGFCRRDLIPADMQSTCGEWSPTKTVAELQSRLR